MGASAAPARKRRPYHHGDLRQALLDAALELASTRSLDAVTLRDVARVAKVSVAAPYHHFRSRSELLDAVCNEGFLALAAALNQVPPAPPGASRERLESLGRAYVAFSLEHPAHFKVMFKVTVTDAPEVGPRRQRTDRPDAFGILLETVERMAKEHQLEANPRSLALTAWSLVHGFSSIAVEGPLRQLPRAQVLRTAAEVIRLGVGGLLEQA